MFKKVGLGFLFVGLAFGVMALCEITRGVGADASVKASVLWPREKSRKIYHPKQSSEGKMYSSLHKKRGVHLCAEILN